MNTDLHPVFIAEIRRKISVFFNKFKKISKFDNLFKKKSILKPFEILDLQASSYKNKSDDLFN